METSKAVILKRFGGPEVLSVEAVPMPQPLDDEVLVRVAAASLNPVDYKIRQGGYPLVTADKLPLVMGRDLAGTIEICGTRAHYMLTKGDPVFAFIGQDRGAQSEYVLVKAIELVAAPKQLDMAHAAAVPLAAITAWQGLFDHGGLQAGQRVLIHGGAGGVGHMAVQLAKTKGTTVFATASGHDLDFVRGLGADIVIDYETERFEDKATDMDVVFDLIGGETQARSWAVLRDGGIMVSTLGEPDTSKAGGRNVRVGPGYHAQPNAAQLGQIAALIDAGKVKVTVSETFGIDNVRAAHERLEHGGVRGEIVLTLA